LTGTLTAAGGPLLFGVRLWTSVCLALFVAFWLELDNPFWAGTSAAIVCQPQLGASLRKGWFRMVGTVVGGISVVVLTACVPQDRIAFLGFLALWGGVCAFAATVFRNFASYAAALAGYTAAIIAADILGAGGGANAAEVFMLAVTRASEISIGIVCAGVVLAGTDFGGAQRRLAASFATLAAEITGGFIRMMELTGPELPDTQPNRRELVRHVIALDPVIDQALGESTHVRHHAPTLQTAVYGLFRALEGWRGAAMHVSRSPDEMDRQGTETILRSIPPELRSARESDSPVRWMADPMALRHVCEMAVRRLVGLPAGTPSLRLLADETAKVLAGMSQLLDGLALLVDAPGRPRPGNRGFRLGVPDWLPALVNAGRAFVAIGAVELFWIGTAWPNGASTIVFVATVLLLLSPRGDLAYGGAIAFTVGTAGAVLCAAMIKFAVLPALQTFPAFCVAIGLVLVPAGFAMAQNWQPAALAVFTATGANFMPLLAPTNQMSYDTAQFYNTALAVIAGCGAAALSFGVLPSLSAAVRTRRLLALALRDLRRLAGDPLSRKSANWEARMYGRLRALPDDAEPLQRAQLLAALSAGSEIAQLRRLCLLLGLGPDLDAALTAVAQGNSTTARAGLARLDRQLASLPEAEAEPRSKLALRVRAKVLVLSDVLAQHAAYFDAGGPHEIH
jgi:uncharacterized membrane protein YccC